MRERADFEFRIEELPEDDAHRIVFTIDGIDSIIPTAPIATNIEGALRPCDRLKCRLGSDRNFWSASAARVCTMPCPESAARNRVQLLPTKRQDEWYVQ